MLPGAGEQGEIPFWAATEPAILARCQSSRAGLSSAQATARRMRPGIVEHRFESMFALLLRQFLNPITIILVIATIISALLGEVIDASVILAIVLLSALLSFRQEFVASRAVEDLLRKVQVTVDTLRDGVHVIVPAREIVTGDVIFLDTGDLIPGDCRILESEDVLVDESSLTGESFPSEKTPTPVPASTPLPDRTNVLFMGTHIVRGTATAVVAATGTQTELGSVARELERKRLPTRFEQGLTRFGGLLLRVMIVLVALVLAVNLLLRRPIVDSLLFSVALAVGLTPQLLPAIVTVSLSVGARQMARAKVIVKRLNVIEDFGQMDILCTDKTGTLTLGAVTLSGAVTVDGTPSDAVLRAATLNATHQTGYANPIDGAILAGTTTDVSGSARLDELPYDFQRKRLSVLVRDGETTLITKGAVDSVVSICDALDAGGDTLPLDAHQRERISDQFHVLSNAGARVLAVARRAAPATDHLRAEDERNLTFLGFLTFIDPPKSGIAETLLDLAAIGISTRIVTGDNRFAASHVARVIGLDDTVILTGSEIDSCVDADLPARVRNVSVFAELTPIHKARIIGAFRRAGHDVGYLGDGINDAPSLHVADVGISVDTAADVAKHAASVVLMEKDLEVLLQGVRLGRRTFANTLKYIFVTSSANVGNMLSMAGAAAFLPFLPLLPLQILLLNFLSDLPSMAIATDDVDPELIAAPEAWDLRLIAQFMATFGILSSVFDTLTFLALRLMFDAGPALFRSAWFVESVGTELAVLLVLRTRRPFYRSKPGPALLWSSLGVAAITVALPFSPLKELLRMTSLGFTVLATLAAITAGYVVATELAKRWFYRHAVSSRPV